MKKSSETILRILCKDGPGIIARISGLVSDYGGNILAMEQHSEEDSGLFAARLHIERLKEIKNIEGEMVQNNPFQQFQYWLDDFNKKLNVAVLVTKEETCLYDILIKQQLGELNCDIPLIISNREDLKTIAKQFSIPFHYLPIDKNNPQDQEQKISDLLNKHQIDLTLLARYMRILSPSFVQKRLGKIINIHHSFLPAFKGANPYRQAWERGVKMIGATAHYVTDDLDEGPIIHQSVTQVNHQYSVQELIRAGRELERMVLAQAVRAHLEHRVLLLGKRTIVFHF